MDEDSEKPISKHTVLHSGFLQKEVEVDWYWNYSAEAVFSFSTGKPIENECNIRGVTFQALADARLMLFYRRSPILK